MDEINALLSPEIQAVILQVLVGAGVLVPFLDWVVSKTATPVDDGLLAKFKGLLRIVGTILPGPGGVKTVAQEVKVKP